MRKLFLIAAICCSSICFSQYKYANLDVKFTAPESELNNFTFKNLRIYPIRAKEAFIQTFKDMGKYTTLKDAINKKKVVITEKGSGGSVNTLLIENISRDTVYIMSGEVVKGGQQDRVIQQDFVLGPKSGKKDLSVFCVEHGRWSSNGTGQNFNGYFNVSSVGLRKVIEKEKNQSKVWDKVSEINAANGTSTSSGTYTAITQSKDFSEKLKQYLAFFKNKFNADDKVIGVIVVTGNKVVGCDMFATNDLFKKNFENLLASYATEAIMHGSNVNISAAVVQQYMDKLLSNEKQQETTLDEKGNKFINNGMKIRVSSY